MIISKQPWRFLLPVRRILLLMGSTIVLSNFFLATKLPSPEFTGGTRFLRESQDQQMPLSGMHANEEDKEILHIVTTRFMQAQAGLKMLGKARLKLFETFCLPSMQQQVIDNFLWFVMVDPNLEDDLVKRLQFLLAPHPNYYLILSNEKLLTPQTLVNTREVPRILTGDKRLLYSRMMDMNRSLLMETRLDADDGLHRKTLVQIQYAAIDLPNVIGVSQVICADVHLEWRNDQITNLNNTCTGDCVSGKIRLVKEDICVTPGYTLVRHRESGDIDFPSWPRIGHQQINSQWPSCNSTKGGKMLTKDCWTRLPKYPSAMRSRTITSAGMSRVQTSPKDKKFEDQTDYMWEHVSRDFGINKGQIILTSQFMRNNIQGIVLDNLRGQCTSGHSCKESSREKLETLVNMTVDMR